MTTTGMRDRLLVVDDEPTLRRAMFTYFTVRGFEVDCVATLTSALDQIARCEYVAVISDLRLSGTDGEEGLELLHALRALSAKTPFVLFTGYGTPAIEAEVTQHGFAATLTKPHPLGDVADVVADLRARSRATRTTDRFPTDREPVARISDQRVR